MTAARHPRRRIALAAGLATAFVVACAATRPVRNDDVTAHRPTLCGSLAPCPYDWPRWMARLGTADRVRIALASMADCHWGPCDPP